MEFIISKTELEKALSVLKNSSAQVKTDDEMQSLVKIEAKLENGISTVKFLTTNMGIWACSTVTEENFKALGADSKKFFDVKTEGSVFVTGPNFISRMLTYPQNSVVRFFTSDKSSDKSGENSSFLEAEYTEIGKKKKFKKSGFLLKNPGSAFEEEPPVENRTTTSIVAGKLHEAVKSVEFSSSRDETLHYLWGVRVEITGDNIATFATDKSRICWFDEQGLAKQDGSPEPFIFIPIKTSFMNALKSLCMADPVTIEKGEKFTILRQSNQWHGIPNIIEPEKMAADWRRISEDLRKRFTYWVKIPKKLLLDFIKTALTDAMSRFGIRLRFNTIEKMIEMSIDRIESGNILRSFLKEGESIDDGDFSGDVDESLVLAIENVKDILEMLPDEIVTVKFTDNLHPVEICGSKESIGYITTTTKIFSANKPDGSEK